MREGSDPWKVQCCHQHPSTHSVSSFPGSLSQEPPRAACGPKETKWAKGLPWVQSQAGLIGPLGGRWCLGGAALRRERPKELLRGAPFPFQYCWVHSCVLTLRPEEATPCREGAFPRRLAEKGFLKWPRILAVHLPPTWACLYLCVAGFHFNGSNLRMRQCHFYEVGVKKIYSLFQKAFFFFSEGERCRITSGVLWSPLLHSLCPPSLRNFIFMSLLEDKAWLAENLDLPVVSTSVVGTTGSFSMHPFPPLSGLLQRSYISRSR